MNREEIIDKMIEWFEDKRGNVTYSMENRTGPYSYDCSSSVYYAVCYALGLDVGYPTSTESMHDFLLNNGFECVADNTIWDSERGDIFILGRLGFSAGAGGHTGVYIDEDNIIHCNYASNGISIDRADFVLDWESYGWYGYRLKEDVKTCDDVKEQFAKRYVITDNYSIDSLPWFCSDRKNIGSTKDYIGYCVTISRNWGGYWYSEYLGGFVDYRAFKEICEIDKYLTVKAGSYSVDTLPWGMKGFKTVMSSDDLIGKSFHITAKLGDYYYLEEIAKWVDIKAFD